MSEAATKIIAQLEANGDAQFAAAMKNAVKNIDELGDSGKKAGEGLAELAQNALKLSQSQVQTAEALSRMNAALKESGSAAEEHASALKAMNAESVAGKAAADAHASALSGPLASAMHLTGEAGHLAGEALKEMGEMALHAVESLGHIAGHAAIEGLHLIGEGALKAGEGVLSLGEHIAHIAFEGLVEGAHVATEALLHLGEAGLHALEHIGKESVGLAGDYQASMNRVQFLTQASTEDMKQFNLAAIDIGKNTVFSSKSAAEGMALLAQMGYKTNDVIMLNKTAANAAMIANTDLKSAIGNLTTVLGAFGIPADKADQTLNEMVKATQMGKLNFDEFQKVMSRAGGVAQSSNQDFAETSAAILTMTNTGQSAELASQHLASALVGLEKPNSKASAMMKELGLNIYDAQGKMVPYSNIVRQLSTQTSKLTDEERNYALATIFGKTNITTMVDAMNAQVKVTHDGVTETLKGADAIEYWADQIRNSDGAVDDAGKILKSGFNYQVKQMKGSIEEAMISIGNGLLPSLTTLVVHIQDVVNKFIDMETEHKTISNALKEIGNIIMSIVGPAFDLGVRAIEGFYERVGLIKLALAPLTDALHQIALAHKPVQDAFDRSQTSAQALAKTFQFNHPILLAFGDLIRNVIAPGVLKASEAFDFFRAGLKGIDMPTTKFDPFMKTLNEMGMAIGKFGPKILELAGAAFHLYETFSPLSNAFKIFEGFLTGGSVGALDAFQSVLINIATALGVSLPDAVNISGSVVKFLSDAFTVASDIVTNIFLPALTGVGSFIISTVLPALGDIGNFITTNVIPAIQQFAGWLSTNVGPILESLGVTFQTTILPALQQFGTFVTTTVVPALQDLFTWVGNNVVPVLESLAGFIASTVIPIVGQLAAFFLTQVVPAAMSVFQAISAFLAPILERVSNFITSTLVPALTQIGQFIQTNVIPAMTQMWSFINANVMPIFIQVAGFLGGVLAQSFDFAATTAKLAWDLIGTTVSTTWNVLSGIWNAITAFLRGDLSGAFTALQQTVGSVWDGIQSAISSVWSAVSGIFDQIDSVLGGSLSSAFTTFQNLISTVWDAVQNAISNAWSAISSTWDNVTSGLSNLGSSFSDLQSGVSNVWESITSAIGDAVNSIKSKFDEIVSSLGNFVREAVDKASNLGSGIIDGIMSGLRNSAGQVIDFLRKLGGDAINAALAALGIHSPSREFAEKVGKPIMQGWAVGMEENVDLPLMGIAAGANRMISFAQQEARTAAISPPISPQQIYNSVSSVVNSNSSAPQRITNNNLTLNLNSPGMGGLPMVAQGYDMVKANMPV